MDAKYFSWSVISGFNSLPDWLKYSTNTLTFYMYKAALLIQLYFPSYIWIVAPMESELLKLLIHL